MATFKVRNILRWFTDTARAIGTGITAAALVERFG